MLGLDVLLHQFFEIQFFVFDKFSLDSKPLLSQLLPNLVSDFVVLHSVGSLFLVALDGRENFGLGRKKSAFVLDHLDVSQELGVVCLSFLEESEEIVVGERALGGAVGEVGGLFLEGLLCYVKGFKGLTFQREETGVNFLERSFEGGILRAAEELRSYFESNFLLVVLVEKTVLENGSLGKLPDFLP